MEQTSCKCPEPRKNTLPEEVWEYAIAGDDQRVRAWLYSGGDVNAATDIGDTLLSTAASNRQFSVLKEILRFPTLHLNTYHSLGGIDSYTPLWLAAENGSLECVNALLQTKLACRIDLIASKGTEISALMAATDKGNWAIVKIILNAHQNLNRKNVNYILPRAAEEMEWDTVLNVISKCTQLEADTLNPLLNKAYELDEWLVVCAILDKRFRYKNESFNRIFSKTVKTRNWERVIHLMKMMQVPLTFDMTLVTAALSEQENEVEKLLEENKYEDETANGSLIVIAAGGTSDKVVRLLYDNRYFSSVAQEHALFLSSLNGHLEFLQYMFARKTRHKFSYHSLCRAQRVASEAGHLNTDKLLVKLLDKEADTFTYNY